MNNVLTTTTVRLATPEEMERAHKPRTCAFCGDPIHWKCHKPECQERWDEGCGYRRARAKRKKEQEAANKARTERLMLQFMEEAKARGERKYPYPNPEDDDWEI